MLERLKNVVRKSTSGGKLVLIAAIDVSGSINMTEFRQHIKDINSVVLDYSEYELHILTFDHQLRDHTVFTQSTIVDIDKYLPYGAGGNEPTVIYDYLKSNPMYYHLMVIFSDGFLPIIDKNKPFENTIYVLSNRDTRFEDPNCEILYW